MKKLLSIMAMVAVIFATSCQRVEDPTGLGTTSEVTFSVQSPDQLTRTIGDGSEATNLIVAVYDKKGDYLDKVSPTSPINGSGNHWDVTLSLVDGMAYDIVFWAQADGAPYSLNQNEKTLTVNYENAKAQDEKRDAFYAVVEDYEADGANTVAVKLTRPFAQLNIVTTDYTTAANSGVNVTTTGLKVSNLPTTMNLLSGDVSGNTEAVFSDANKPTESHPSFTNTSDVEYTWLSMNYVLASEEGDLISTVTLTGTTKEKVYREIPVKRNFRTNIYGKILTSDVDFDVDTDQEFDGNEDIEVWDGESTAAPKFVKEENGKYYYEINSPEQLAGMVQGVKADENPYYESNVVITLTKDIDLGAAYWTPIGPNADANDKFKGTFDGQDHTIYNLKVKQGAAYHAAGLFGALNGTVMNLVIENAEIESVSTGSQTDNGTAVVAGSIYPSGTIDRVTVRNVKVKGNRYVGAIAGYAYGNITKCKVEIAELTATPDQCSGAFDNGDKVGAIAGYWSSSKGKYIVEGNTVKDVKIKGYRDIGGVIGCGDQVETLQNNNVNKVSLIIDQSTGFYGEKDSNAAAIIGRITTGQIGANNTSSEVSLEVIAQTAAPIAQALKAEYKAISVKLANDIDLPINSLGQITAGSGEYKLGGENTENITIDLNDNKLNVTTTYWSALGAKNANAIFTIKNGTMTSSSTSGTWNSYDLSFANCNYQIEEVVFDKAVAFTNAGKAVTINGVTINETHDYYAMWISAEGQVLTIDGLTINSAGRGIKIDEQYVDSPAKVSMNICNAKFTTANKAAILVKSVEGAEITWGEGNDISEVAKDKDFAVWVDEDAADYADKVVVNGAFVKVEGSSSDIVNYPDEVNDAISTGGTVVLATDVTYSSNKIENDLSLYLNDHTFEATGTITLSNNANLTMIGGDYVVNSTSSGYVDVRPSTAEGSVVVYENIDFSYNKLGPTYGPSTDRLGSVVEVCATVSEAKTKIKFKNCTFTNAMVLFEGLSSTTGEVDAVFENCTFNALTSSAPIYVQNYIKGSITVRGCTFNLECTSSTASAISVSPSTSTDISVTAENNTIEAIAATPYTHNESKGETNVHDVKVNGTPSNIKFISAYGNTTITETGTTKKGIAAN